MTQNVIDTSKVYFIGAGPGDCELITLKGYRILSQADIVIYAGSLINHDLLQYCKEDAACYDSASLNLEEIIELMKDGISAGKLVVRLQTGDLSLYGSIREQGEELGKLGIGFASVPGVSSFLGAAAQLGVEYTVPEVSQSLIITRMAGRTPTPAGESLEAFAAHQTSMAIFLSVQEIEEVVKRLNEGGYPLDTPVAVIYKATWPDERKVEGTLADIAAKVRDGDIRKTALILVGKFLGEEYHYSKLYDASFSHEYRTA
ncbi:cobalt-precorrin-4 methyltransferase [Neisseria sp. Ec49-e6-T10]|uniref:cobalt-precorrin-4 methyltransferase n=1 Tax=Neisseria sp. Ec49-e6-T10 TaxID=3140744 RepID=UPI003EBD44DF